jgi:hypothetical protein
MPAGTKEYSTFVKGLVTEASAITFPENASIDEANFVLNRDGSRQRRLGIDYESSYTLVDSGLASTFMDNASLSVFRWDNVDNNPTISIGIIQIYNQLWFVDLFTNPLSGNLLNSSSSLTITGIGNDPVSFSQVNGIAVGTNKNIDPFYLSYDSSTDTITKTDIGIETRDLWGISDSLDVDERSSSLTNYHKYNLLNQGWTTTNINAVKTGKGVYPSNADIMVLGKDSSDDFSAGLLFKQYFGNTPAPKGKYIIDAFNRSSSRDSLSGLSTPIDSDDGRPSTVASYSRRIFYSGITSNTTGSEAKAPNYGGGIFFTKVINSNEDLGACYQEADPTSEHVFDIIDSDGGFISIPEASNILKLETTETSIVVIAENGVWEIFGDTGGFTATSYQISKVTNIGAVNAGSVVNAEGSILYWSKGGIYVISVDRVSGRLTAQNITEQTIQTYYNNIPSVGKANAVGSFDPASRKISWLYNDTDDYDGVVDKNKYNKELIFDAVLQAFYPNSVSDLDTDSPYIAGYISTPNFLSSSFTQNVVHNGTQVQVDGEDVVITDTFRTRGASVTKYLTVKPSTSGNYKFTFAQYSNPDFLDWYSDDNTGADFTSYLETGYDLFDTTLVYKQVPYILFHFKRTETGFESLDGGLAPVNPSSCLVQARWDFANHSNSGKYGTQFQAYRLKRNYIPSGISDNFDYGHSVITTKSKLRGRGRALSLYISSESSKDMYLLGWAVNVVAGDVV